MEDKNITKLSFNAAPMVPSHATSGKENKKTNSCSCAIGLLQKEVNLVKETTRECKDLLQNLIKSEAMNTVLLQQLTKQNEKKFKFPITSIDDLVLIEDDMDANKKEYVATISRIIFPQGILKSLEKLITTKVLLEFNFSGLKGKRPFKHFHNFNAVLLECLSKEGYTEKQFSKDMKKAFQLAKARHFKNESTKKQNAIITE